MCSTKPSQDSSSICSTYHSATACFTRRVSVGVAFFAFAPVEIGSSAAHRATPACSSSYSTFVPKYVRRATRSMDSQITAAKRRSGRWASASRSAMPPSRGTGMSKRVWAWECPRWARSLRPDSTS
ncbi:hypothetical protein [Streptacidiphilus carbonis]|uniref:hypothetical protein n=1 Tax=Streptacidiphilus carbonis TaxID=105422 RepID=UPI001F38E286|nr:hypothetical protein [Streptacidiphilus carbonis]